MSRRTRRSCPATGKRQYKRHEADRAVTLAGRQAHSAQVPVSCYRCEHCRKWHLTGMTQLEYQVRQLVGEVA